MALRKSKHNIVAKIGQGNALVANPLYGTADMIDADELRAYESEEAQEDLVNRQYLVDPEAESRFFRQQYMDFLDTRDTDEIQLFYVPDYGCNFACDYCYQSEYAPTSGQEARAVIDGFFAYVDQTFAGRSKYVTLFGGEPLLPSQKAQETITHFLALANERQIDTAIVTNGYAIDRYIDVLKASRIREVQVTLDGMAELHNQRRPLKGGAGTFDQVVAGVDLLLANNLPVNLRMVVDAENMAQLPALAQFAIDRGWTANPLFKTQLGRNYELHSCQARRQALYTRTQMYGELADLIQQHPHIKKFHTPSFHLLKPLAQEGTLPDPVFDSCPGCKTEWAFDYTGSIYSCTATVGKKGEELGTFFPEVTLDEEAVEEWQDRDVLAIEQCRTCEAALVCGGGCGSVAKNTNGSLHSPDCRPVKEIMEAGFPVFFTEDGTPKK